jgi:hypothetical protein
VHRDVVILVFPEGVVVVVVVVVVVISVRIAGGVGGAAMGDRWITEGKEGATQLHAKGEARRAGGETGEAAEETIKGKAGAQDETL